MIPPNAISTGRPSLLANSARETPPVITVDVVRHLSITTVIVLNRNIFFDSLSQLQFHQANMLPFQLISSSYKFVDLVLL